MYLSSALAEHGHLSVSSYLPAPEIVLHRGGFDLVPMSPLSEVRGEEKRVPGTHVGELRKELVIPLAGG